MLEHDAKGLLKAHGVLVPEGVLADSVNVTPPFAPPWFVKAQVPVGGRGKAGGIRRVDHPGELSASLEDVLGRSIRGHPVRECRIEQGVPDAAEAYLSLSVDPATGGTNILISAEGGVEIESEAGRAGVLSGSARRAPDAIAEQVAALASGLSALTGAAIADAGRILSKAFCEIEATLLEINPLLVRADGAWLAGDVKIILDESAFARRPALADLVRVREAAYPEAALKLAQEFDYVELDADGVVGLVTTGAGLSMQLIDEFVEMGLEPYNFCDIRSGTFRGDPARLIWVMQQIAKGGNVRAVLVNIFAGVTHLGELAQLLLQAIEAVPELRAPIIVRLVGNGFDEAKATLDASGVGLTLVTDLDDAVRRVAQICAAKT